MNTHPLPHAHGWAARKPLRLLPGVVIAALLVIVRYLLPAIVPDGTLRDALQDLGVLGGMAGALLIVLWWLLLSRAQWIERLGAIAVMAAALFATRFILHPSIAGGMMGFMIYVYAMPVLAIALVAWSAVTRGSSQDVRRASLVITIVVACAAFGLVRTEGIIGGMADFRWRWSLTPEERLLAQGVDVVPPAAAAPPASKAPVVGSAESAPVASTSVSSSKPGSAAPAVPTEAATTPPVKDPEAPRVEWSGFRGPARDSVVRGMRIETDWVKSPPREMWRRPIGPGWSSFAVSGDILYTQEQRGEDEIVAAYRVSSGAPVWRHSDPARFYESNGGAGPRATPSLGNGRLYTLGATGIVNALDARTGAVLWSRNAATDTGAKLPGWGFTGSPLVLDDRVIVAASGRLVAYDRATGEPQWSIQTKGGSYSSPQLTEIGGVRQILMLSGFGATSVSPADGEVLWEHAWEGVRLSSSPRSWPTATWWSRRPIRWAGSASAGSRLPAARTDGKWKSAGRRRD